MTFSIVGTDGAGGIGVAVASKFLAVGGVVPYLQSGVGAVATQSYVNPRFGPQSRCWPKAWPRKRRRRSWLRGTAGPPSASSVW